MEMTNPIEIPVGGGEVLEVELDQLSNQEMMHQIRKILVDELAVRTSLFRKSDCF